MVEAGTRRIKLLIAAMICSMGGIVLRIGYLQVRQHSVFSLLGEKNVLRREVVAPPRGDIVDCHGLLLATNRPVITLVWHPSGKRTLSDHDVAIITQVAEYIAADVPLTKIAHAEKTGRRYTIARDLSFELLSKIAEPISRCPNLQIITDFQRFYPRGTHACHAVGYLSALDQTGMMGLEKIFEELLKGAPGELTRTVTSSGRELELLLTQNPLPGESIKTTLDSEVQAIAEAVFPSDKSGVIMLMHARTGALEVLLSYPGFDPNIFLGKISTEEWASLAAGKPFINRACMAYPPASLFKLVTITAALEEGIIQKDSCWACHGSILFASREYHCNNRHGHGIISFDEVIAKSCNIPLYEIARKIKIDTLEKYAKKLGLGRPTGILLPERVGLIPSVHWKRTVKKEPWYPGETLSTSIGQGPLLANPTQILRLIIGLVDGYLVKPRLLEQEAIEYEPVDISPSTRDALKQAMRHVITHGLGQKLRAFRKLTILGKTGTAQVVGLDSVREERHEFIDHAWLAAHLTYENEEPRALVIFIEHAGSSRVATDVAKAFLREYCQLIEKRQKSAMHSCAAQQPDESSDSAYEQQYLHE
jgi:penicillin-binding protein 2